MKFSEISISRAELVAELKAYRAKLVGDAEFFAVNVGWWGRAKLDAVKAELNAVCELLASLVGKVAKAAQTGTNRPRCAFHKEIRRVFAIARDKGLDTKDDEAMRASFGRSLGRRIESRDELNGGDWQAVGDLMKRGTLAW